MLIRLVERLPAQALAVNPWLNKTMYGINFPLTPAKLKNSRMPVMNEQIYKNRNFTLHIKCKIRILIIITEYVYGKVNIDVELDFERSEDDS